MSMGKGGTSSGYMSDRLGLKGHKVTCVPCAEALKSYLREHARFLALCRKRAVKGRHICQLSEVAFDVPAGAGIEERDALDARRRRPASPDGAAHRPAGALRSPSERDIGAELKLMGQLELPLKGNPHGSP